MQCGDCGFDNPTEMKFCGECATPLVTGDGARAYELELHECRAHLARLRGEVPLADREIEEARRLYTEMGAKAQLQRLAQF